MNLFKKEEGEQKYTPAILEDKKDKAGFVKSILMKLRTTLTFSFFLVGAWLWLTFTTSQLLPFLAETLHEKPVGVGTNGQAPFWDMFIWAFSYTHQCPDLLNHYELKAFWELVLWGVVTVGWYFLLGHCFGLKTKEFKGEQGTGSLAHTLEEVKETGLILPEFQTKEDEFSLKPSQEEANSVMVGGWKDPKTGRLYYLRDGTGQHIMALAPTRSGKGVSLVVPTLLSWGQSVVVNDAKGELWTMTSGWRSHYANNKCLKFAPADLQDTCSWNVLDEVRAGTPHCIADVQNISQIMTDTGEKKDHWNSSAEKMLTGTILYVLDKARKEEKPTPSLPQVANILSNPKAKDSGVLWNDMKSWRAEDKDVQGVINRTGADYSENKLSSPAEYGSITSTLKRLLRLYHDPIISRNISHSDFQVMDLVQGDQPVSLYLVVRGGDVERIKPLTRMLVTMLTNKMMTVDLKRQADNRVVSPYKHRLLYMMDEFPALKKLEGWENVMAQCAGYGIKIYLITQDFAQLRAVYGKDEAITPNCQLKVAFGTNSYSTAKELSDMSGIMTVSQKEITENLDKNGLSTGASQVYRSHQRAVLTPDEVTQLQKLKVDMATGKVKQTGQILVFGAGEKPILGEQVLYFLDPMLKERSLIPPISGDIPRKEVVDER